MYFNVSVETTLSRIVLEKVSKHLRVSQVVDCNNFDSFVFDDLAESQTTNTSKSVNTNFYCHVNFLLRVEAIY